LLLGQHYRLLECLGEGGMGRTYLARDLRFVDTANELCVIKELKSTLDGATLPTELFRREASRLLDLRHTGIPAYRDFFWARFEKSLETHPRHFLVQQYIKGHSLQSRLDDVGPLPLQEALRLMKEVLLILQYLHERNDPETGKPTPLLHLDIKPDNLMQRESDGRIFLIDFGIAAQLTTTWRATHGAKASIHGYTPGFAPFEQTMGYAAPASDLYAWAMTFLVVLTNQSPLELFDPIEQSSRFREFITLPDPIADIFDRTLTVQIKERVQSARELLAALDPGAVQGDSVITHPGTAAPPHTNQPLPTGLAISSDSIASIESSAASPPAALPTTQPHQPAPGHSLSPVVLVIAALFIAGGAGTIGWWASRGDQSDNQSINISGGIHIGSEQRNTPQPIPDRAPTPAPRAAVPDLAPTPRPRVPARPQAPIARRQVTKRRPTRIVRRRKRQRKRSPRRSSKRFASWMKRLATRDQHELYDTRRKLKQMGNKALPIFRTALKHSEYLVRIRATHALTLLPKIPTSFYALMRSNIKEPKRGISKATLTTLGSLLRKGHKKALPLLMNALDSPRETTRQDTLQQFRRARYQSPRLTAKLLSLYKREKGRYLKGNLATAIGAQRILPPGTLQALYEGTMSAVSHYSRDKSMTALHDIAKHEPKAIRYLIRIAENDRQQNMTRRAFLYLARLARYKRIPRDYHSAVSKVAIQGLARSDLRAVLYAVGVIDYLNVYAAIPDLRKLQTDADSRFKQRWAGYLLRELKKRLPRTLKKLEKDTP
jgi:serine/threonine protein kinase